MQKIAESRDGKCLSKEYLGVRKHLLWECLHGHQWEATPDNVKNLHTWCPYCSHHFSLTIEEMQQIAKRRGGKCLSKEYLGIGKHLLWECSFGHQWRARPSMIKYDNTWCPYCNCGKSSTIEEMQQIAENHGGKCLSGEYLGTKTHLLWECFFGHQWKANPVSIKYHNSWCPECRKRKADLYEPPSKRRFLEEYDP
jgi:ribosomal protein L44E